MDGSCAGGGCLPAAAGLVLVRGLPRLGPLLVLDLDLRGGFLRVVDGHVPRLEANEVFCEGVRMETDGTPGVGPAEHNFEAPEGVMRFGWVDWGGRLLGGQEREVWSWLLPRREGRPRMM